MSGSVSSNDSARLVRSREDDSSDDGSVDLPAQANPSDREGEANSGGGSDHPDSEFEEEDMEEEEDEENEQDFQYEQLPSLIKVDPKNPLGSGLGPGIELVRIDNMPSQSTVDTIRDMIRDRGLLIAEEDILIPTTYDRPWTPVDGFLCLYESFFMASALWFPLPKLLIEYYDRRLIAISQLTHAAVRNIVTVMTLAAEIGRSVNCLEFEEMVQFKRKGPHWTCTRPSPNKIDKLLLVLKQRGGQNWPELLEQRVHRCSLRVNTGRINLPLAPLRPFTLRVPKDRKSRSKKAKAQVGTMVKPERKVVKYTGTPMSRSVPKYDKKAGKRAIDSSSLKPSSAIVPAKKQRGESFGKGVGKGNINRRSKSIEPASSGVPTIGGEMEETENLSTFDFEFSFKGYGKHISDVPEKCAEFLRCVQGHLRQYDPTLDFADKSVYTLYAEELIRAVSHVNFMATRLEKTELRIIKLTSEVEVLKGKLDRQVEMFMEMTEEAESARGREKAAGNKLGMMRDQLERERNEKDAKILLLKKENEKLMAAGTDVVQKTVQTTIGKALSEMRIRADGIDIPDEKIEKIQADLKSLNEEFDSLDVEVAKPEDYLVTPVAERVPLDLPSFQLDFGEGSHTRPAHEDVPTTEEAEIVKDEEDAQDEGGEVGAMNAFTNEELAPLFPSSKDD
ncbi:hypothetical protein AALP_AAs65400U000100 [Arabis alpina]|uniref:Uncharacterized protein n=1 Tax=Arabis alpina TaxID=50452 RepID=A0A087G3R9_ARAAL|nr:hypothetical protein AALP_AAs65400U000100 [Arabis alpina]